MDSGREWLYAEHRCMGLQLHADILGYRPGAPYPRISLDRHREILDKLRTHAERVPEDEGVVDLAIRMLAWNPSQRLTAAEALEHRCWAPIRTP